MSSLKMHIAISMKIQKYFNFSDDFLLGTILPDIFKLILKDKVITHFEDNSIIILEKFIKSQNNIKNELVLGYYAHLIEDYIWYEKYMKNKYMKLKEYSDYKIYNDYSYIDSILYTKLNIQTNIITNKLYTSLNNIDITEIQLLNNDNKNKLQISIIKDMIDKYWKDYISDGTNYFYKLEDAESYYNLAFEEVKKRIEEIM